MKQSTHREMTKKIFDILKSTDSNFALYQAKVIVADQAENTDNYRDLEFVHVQGGRDNPHRDEWYTLDDDPHYKFKKHYFTAYNHFIDIKKGPGIFDDYDGYSYRRGSASRDEYQKAEDATDDIIIEIMGYVTGKKVDEGIMWWFNDEYVHAPGRKWYKKGEGCSPSVKRYSYYRDKGKYDSFKAEAKARFPLADSVGKKNKGIPYSVFMPVDNLARYWFDYYVEKTDSRAIGPVMHAIQDASIPHHAAGYTGNWHSEYEAKIDKKYESWFQDSNFKNDVIKLFESWNVDDPTPPDSLKPDDWQRKPGANWRIDFLVTWVALNAYHSYANTYNHFKNGWKFVEDDAKELTKKATAVCMLVLRKLSPKPKSFPFKAVNPKETDLFKRNVQKGSKEIKFIGNAAKKTKGVISLPDKEG